MCCTTFSILNMTDCSKFFDLEGKTRTNVYEMFEILQKGTVKLNVKLNVSYQRTLKRYLNVDVIC